MYVDTFKGNRCLLWKSSVIVEIFAVADEIMTSEFFHAMIHHLFLWRWILALHVKFAFISDTVFRHRMIALGKFNFNDSSSSDLGIHHSLSHISLISSSFTTHTTEHDTRPSAHQNPKRRLRRRRLPGQRIVILTVLVDQILERKVVQQF